jgi:nucleolar protein 14
MLLREPNTMVPRPANLSSILSEDIDDPEKTKVDLLGISLKLLKKFGDMHQGLDGAVELLGGLHNVVTKLKLQGCSPELQVRCRRVYLTPSYI